MIQISVIVPTYKPGEYIKECLMSLYHQTLDRTLYQVVVVLNGCNEPYRSDLLDFINRNMPGLDVDFVQVDSPGVSNARNVALQRMKGDYVAFVDDDDVVSGVYLQSLLKAADRNIVSISNVRAFTHDISASTPYYISRAFERYQDHPLIRGFQMRKFLSSACCKLISSEIIGGHRFDGKIKNSEDAVFMLEISRNIHGMRCTSPQAVYYRRFREGSALTKRRSRRETTINYGHALLRSLALSIREPFKYNHLLVLIKCLALVRTGLLALFRR